MKLEAKIENYPNPLGARLREMLREFTSEMEEVLDGLRGDLVCGLGKEMFVKDDGNLECRRRDADAPR